MRSTARCSEIHIYILIPKYDHEADNYNPTIIMKFDRDEKYRYIINIFCDYINF